MFWFSGLQLFFFALHHASGCLFLSINIRCLMMKDEQGFLPENFGKEKIPEERSTIPRILPWSTLRIWMFIIIDESLLFNDESWARIFY